MLAARDAPRAPGVYYFLGRDRALLYVGMATDLRRRLHQHARSVHAPSGMRLGALYGTVREVRWELTGDESGAAAREADVIVALTPPFNAAHRLDGRWVYVNLDRVHGGACELRLSREANGERVYGCFPHLGRGVASRPAIACSDGYTALLRLLWAASRRPAEHCPARISRAAPDRFAVQIAEPITALHSFLTGTNARMLAPLVEAGARDPVLRNALERDRTLAMQFFTAGPAALRALRSRHGAPSGPLSRDAITSLIRSDVRAAIGEFSLVEQGGDDILLGRRAHPWHQVRR
jgi:predicted GIY-YIG superfamily endonuclease